MQKSAFLRFIHVKFTFCFWGLRPQTPTGALLLDPPDPLTSAPNLLVLATPLLKTKGPITLTGRNVWLSNIVY